MSGVNKMAPRTGGRKSGAPVVRAVEGVVAARISEPDVIVVTTQASATGAVLRDARVHIALGVAAQHLVWQDATGPRLSANGDVDVGDRKPPALVELEGLLFRKVQVAVRVDHVLDRATVRCLEPHRVNSDESAPLDDVSEFDSRPTLAEPDGIPNLSGHAAKEDVRQPTRPTRWGGIRDTRQRNDNGSSGRCSRAGRDSQTPRQGGAQCERKAAHVRQRSQPDQA